MARRKRDEPAKAAPPRSEQTTRPARAAFPIAGIGASAGGLEAFKEMLAALPTNAGMAYVLVLHLPARHESMLSEILARVSTLPVSDVSDRTRVERNHVYVLPAGFDIDVQDETFVLTPRKAQTGHHRPIDHFLHSLSERLGHLAVGVILSGSGSDGALGIQQVKAAGGITFAQDDTAQQSSMPRSAIQTGAIDFVLNPADIARELGRIAALPIVAAPAAADAAQLPDLEPIIELLRELTGVDFTHYKSNTLYRRIIRRIVLHKLDGFAEYVKMLQGNGTETQALYQDILINVTSFFRNPEAFDALKKEVLPALTNNRSRHDPVRIWTLGCSTGEEAYSLAMAFAEFADGVGRSVPVQVFATDLNSASIEKARAAIYPRSAVAELSSERIRRFFVELDGGYRIAKPIRDACVFARHNVLDDPPFSRIDLVSCRNMLIYLGTELQQKVIPVLHYSLRPGGFLWLGTSETIGAYRDLFDLKNTRYKIYAKKGTLAAQQPAIAIGSPERTRPERGSPAYFPESEPAPIDVQKDIDRILVARYAPASVLVRADLEIVQYRGNTTPYLTPAPGRATLNLLKMLRESLVLGVRSALKRAKTEETVVRQEGLTLSSNGSERKVNIEVIPVKSGVQRADLFMIVFEDADKPEPPKPVPPVSARRSKDAATQEIGQLQQELVATREYLQSVVEQQEAANEELQSANEEVQSANEELQSINEELETSKEEVQSSNEELATVNDELQARNSELAQINNDLINLLGSVHMAIVMLDSNLRIRRFTPMAERLLNLIPTDIGRPVSDIKSTFSVPNLDTLIVEAIDTVSEREVEVQDRQGHWYLMRLRPYRTIENKIDGAVIVLVDVDTLKRSQEMLQQQTALLDQAHEPIIMWDLAGDVTYWNDAAAETYGFSRDQAIGRKADELLLAAPPYGQYREELLRTGFWNGEIVLTRRDGQKIVVESRMVVVTDTGGRKLVVEASRVITERKAAQRVLEDRADDLVAADHNKDEFLAMLAHELRNPLAPLRNLAAALKSPASAEQKDQAVDMLEHQVRNMARLIDDLFDASRVKLAQIALRRERIDVRAVVRHVAQQQASSLEARRQTLQVTLPDTAVDVDGDEIRLEQVVGNLVHNASKFSNPGQSIEIVLEQDETASPDAGVPGQAVIRVTDHGIGIEAADLPRVFDLYMRSHASSDPQHRGLGIGLTVVKSVVELHGGCVEARSNGPGTGSEFIVRLPLANGPSSQVPD